jgi:hypothetical protein
MNVQWMQQAAPCPVVEFHDLRTEKFRAQRYLDLAAGSLTPALFAAGGSLLGHFRVENHPDRLLLLRGFASMTARRKALTAFHAGTDWAAHRAEAAGLTRNLDVSLTRAIRPEEGLRVIRSGGRLALLLSELRFPEQIGNYHLWLRLLLRKAGLDPSAAFATLEAVNDVPAVPVVRHRSQHIALMPAGGRLPELPPELRAMLRYPPEILTLEPAMTLVW